MSAEKLARLLEWPKLADAKLDAHKARMAEQRAGRRARDVQSATHVQPQPRVEPKASGRKPKLPGAGPGLPSPHPAAQGRAGKPGPAPQLVPKEAPPVAKAAPKAAPAAAPKAAVSSGAEAAEKKFLSGKLLKRTAIGAGVLAAGAGAAHLYGRGKNPGRNETMSTDKVAMLCSVEAAKLAKENEGMLSRADRALHKDVDVKGGVQRGLSGAKRILGTQVSGEGSKYDKDLSLAGAKRILNTQVSGQGSKYDRDLSLDGAKRILNTQVSGEGSKYDKKLF